MVISGFIEMDPEANVANTMEAAVKTWSINTNHHQRDAHLRSADFFDVDTYPTMIYKLKSYRRKGDGYTAIAT